MGTMDGIQYLGCFDRDQAIVTQRTRGVICPFALKPGRNHRHPRLMRAHVGGGRVWQLMS